MGDIAGFFERLIRSLKRIGSDIAQLKNVEMYVVAGIAVVFAIVTLFEDSISDENKWTITLAALALLVYNVTVPQKESYDLDELLDDRAHFVPLPERIRGARQLWIYGPSCINILNNENTWAIKNEILDKPNGECRIIIQNPDKDAAMAILRTLLDENNDHQIQELPKAIHDALGILGKMKSWDVQGEFDYKLLDFGPGFSMVAIDPDKRSGVIIVEFYGFYHEHTAGRMHIELTRAQSERWYMYWRGQFERMWIAASPH
jgi:hypothetical protein